MIYLIHGDNQAASRNELNNLISAGKKQKKEIIRFSGKDLTLEYLIQALESQSLFGQERLVIIEEFLSQPKSKRQREIIDCLASSTPMLSQDLTPGVRIPGVRIRPNTGVSIIFWEKKTLTPATLRKLPFIQKAKAFKIPALVFKLVESIYPNNQKQALTYFKELSKNQSAEFTFYMIARQIRLLIKAKDGVLPKMAPWMLGKLKSQANKFNSVNKLTKLYKDLLEVDKSIKTGKTPMDLVWHLDLWLINNLE